MKVVWCLLLGSVTLEVITALLMRIQVFWKVMPCWLSHH